jgi:uncharacterized membrane protein HdeD (DUF308 family)
MAQTSAVVEGPLGSLAGRNALLARNWKFVLFRGVVAILVAVVAFLFPLATVGSLVLLFSAYMLVDGIFAISAAVRAAAKHERWGWLILEGVVDLFAAAVAFLWPAITVISFVLVSAVWALVSGVMALVAAFKLNATHGRAWLIAAAAISLLWGVLLIMAPIAGVIAMTWWLGGYALVFGCAMVGLALRLRKHQHKTVSA